MRVRAAEGLRQPHSRPTSGLYPSGVRVLRTAGFVVALAALAAAGAVFALVLLSTIGGGPDNDPVGRLRPVVANLEVTAVTEPHTDASTETGTETDRSPEDDTSTAEGDDHGGTPDDD